MGSQNKRDLTRQDRSVGFSFPTERSCPSRSFNERTQQYARYKLNATDLPGTFMG